ncbi:MAG: sugar-binding protein, partial [Bacteroidota bacterium]|nr:sugar-binding protein [Bacteroidota bacterium]
MNPRKTLLFIALICCSITAYPYQEGSRICWDYTTQRFATPGGYGRVVVLSTGKLALVYSCDYSIYYRTSSDKGITWSSPTTVGLNNLYYYTNAELLELKNGLLLYTWNARPRVDGSCPYKIMYKLSKDHGLTWGGEYTLYAADNYFINGCWEPKAIQLPSGEVQVYFSNEAPYTNSSEQDISMISSSDNCYTWNPIKILSFRAENRDGMPVPVYLKNNKGMAMSIEDNGIDGLFKPVIITTSNNWGNAPVLKDSPYRSQALSIKNRLASAVYAGAPYLIQLNNSETVLSTQSTEGRTGTNEVKANLQVYVGDASAHNFTNKSTPFPNLEADGSALWNSLCQIDDTTIMAVSSIGGTNGQNGLWTVKGTIVNAPKAMKRAIVVDGICSKDEWNGCSSFPLKSFSNDYATFKTAWDNDYLYVLCQAEDAWQVTDAPEESPWEADGFEVYLDPQNNNVKSLTKGHYKMLVNLGGKVLCEQADLNGNFVAWNPEGYKTKMTRNDDGYTIELAIPWQELGGVPQAESFGLAFKCYNHTEDNVTYHEASSGTDLDRPNSWLGCTLVNEAASLNVSKDRQLSLFVKDKNLHVTFSNALQIKATVSCMDSCGKLLYSLPTISQSTLDIPMQKYAPGVYTIIVSS